jgi:hypothetical protein
MIEFCNDDEGYLAWIGMNPTGFVLNVRRTPNPGYVVLHRASCHSISNGARESGAYTARSYRKICALSVAELRFGARQEGRSDGSFSNQCSHCQAD